VGKKVKNMTEQNKVPEKLLEQIANSPSKRGATEWARRALIRHGETSENRRDIQNAASQRKHQGQSGTTSGETA
jgi:hypothetical protein